MCNSSMTSAFTGMWRLLENSKSGTQELLSRFPINGSPGKAKLARTLQGLYLSKQMAPTEPRLNLNSFMIPKDLLNQLVIRLGLCRGAWRMTLSASKNLLKIAIVSPGRGVARLESRVEFERCFYERSRRGLERPRQLTESYLDFG